MPPTRSRTALASDPRLATADEREYIAWAMGRELADAMRARARGAHPGAVTDACTGLLVGVAAVRGFPPAALGLDVPPPDASTHDGRWPVIPEFSFTESAVLGGIDAMRRVVDAFRHPTVRRAAEHGPTDDAAGDWTTQRATERLQHYAYGVAAAHLPRVSALAPRALFAVLDPDLAHAIGSAPALRLLEQDVIGALRRIGQEGLRRALDRKYASIKTIDLAVASAGRAMRAHATARDDDTAWLYGVFDQMADRYAAWLDTRCPPLILAVHIGASLAAEYGRLLGIPPTTALDGGPGLPALAAYADRSHPGASWLVLGQHMLQAWTPDVADEWTRMLTEILLRSGERPGDAPRDLARENTRENAGHACPVAHAPHSPDGSAAVPGSVLPVSRLPAHGEPKWAQRLRDAHAAMARAHDGVLRRAEAAEAEARAARAAAAEATARAEAAERRTQAAIRRAEHAEQQLGDQRAGTAATPSAGRQPAAPDREREIARGHEPGTAAPLPDASPTEGLSPHLFAGHRVFVFSAASRDGTLARFRPPFLAFGPDAVEVRRSTRDRGPERFRPTDLVIIDARAPHTATEAIRDKARACGAWVFEGHHGPTGLALAAATARAEHLRHHAAEPAGGTAPDPSPACGGSRPCV